MGVAILLLLLVTAVTAQQHDRGCRHSRSRPWRTVGGLSGAPRNGTTACPHGAAKSVLASAYFERLAKEQVSGHNGRDRRIRIRPSGLDAYVQPTLKRQGYPAPASTPRKVTPKDFASADVVISIGCDLSGLEKPGGKLVQWDEVPPLSEDFARADEAIRKRVTELIEELVRSAPKKK